MKTCAIEPCGRTVSREEHSLCYPHWKALQKGKVTECADCARYFESDGGCPHCVDTPPTTDAPSPGHQSSTKLGRHFGMSARKLNLILAELGWIEKFTKGWKPTERGQLLGAEQKEMRGSGIPFVTWPPSIQDHKALVDAVDESMGRKAAAKSPVKAGTSATDGSTAASKDDFRSRFPAAYRAADGHMVRSRGEALIDNYLYFNKIVHAYERKLPIEEDVYCDFYLPDKKVYIEYWGMEENAKYAARKARKQELYAKHGLNLIELGDKDIELLDDTLPRHLLRFGIECS